MIAVLALEECLVFSPWKYLGVCLCVFVCVSVERCKNLLFACKVKHFHPFYFCFVNCMCISVSLSFLGLQIRSNMN